jgi:hypothetical protein
VGEGRLDPRFVDAVYGNAVKNKSGFELFDLEWKWGEPITLSWLVLRNILHLDNELAGLSKQPPFKSLQGLYKALCRETGCHPQLSADLAAEARLRAEVIDPSVDWEKVLRKVLTKNLRIRAVVNGVKNGRALNKFRKWNVFLSRGFAK